MSNEQMLYDIASLEWIIEHFQERIVSLTHKIETRHLWGRMAFWLPSEINLFKKKIVYYDTIKFLNLTLIQLKENKPQKH